MKNQEAVSVAQIKNNPPQIPNCVSFNAIIDSPIFDAGDGLSGFVATGKNGEEFPMIVIEMPLEEARAKLNEGEHICSTGVLIKHKGNWVIKSLQIMRI